MSFECSIIAKLYRFSDETYHIPGKESIVEVSDDNDFFLHFFRLSLYGNGDSLDNQGYVSLSICFRSIVLLKYPLLDVCTIFVSVINTNKKERFTRSFNFEGIDVWNKSISISKYVARYTLVEDDSELLPDNCLTIRLCIILQNFWEKDSWRKSKWNTYSYVCNELRSCVKQQEQKESHVSEFILNIDSVVGRRLYEESSFFKDVIDKRKEKGEKEKMIRIPAQEFKQFKKLCKIIMGSVNLYFSSLDHLRLVYELAYKYDIPSAVETCRALIKLYFMKYTWVDKSEKGDLIMRAADMTGDDILKEITYNFLKRNYAYSEEEGEIDWECTIKAGGNEVLFLHDPLKRKDDREIFNFYS